MVESNTIVSVGMCTKNSGKTVSEAIRSVVEQEFPHEQMEVIIVDGNSQDGTLSIIKKHLSNTMIKAKYFSESIGLGFARQTVVDNASGRYLVWVDGDILLSSDYVRKQVEFMEKNPQVAISVGRFGFLNDDNWVATLENMSYVLNSARHSGQTTQKIIGTEAAIFRVCAIREVGGFNCSIRGAQEDCDVAYRIRKAGWRSHMTNAVFFERQRSTWRELWKQHFWYGYGLHFLKHTNVGLNLISDKTVDRIIFSPVAYKLTHRKIVFLSPLNFIFKKTALFFGYLSAHFDGYGHNSASSQV